MIGYVLPDSSNIHIRWGFILCSVQNFPQIAWKWTLNPIAGQINLETKNSVHFCLGGTPETNNWWDTRNKYQNLGVGQPFSESVYWS